ncbi:MAG: TetR/AcrR family transcriptional regulator [Pseudomonadota bacterium]
MSERRTQIIEAAIPLVLKEGVGASTAKIAKAAGVSNGTLFNVFASKQALIDAIFLAGKTGMFEALSAPEGAPFDRARLWRFWRDYIGWARTHPLHRRISHRLREAGLVSEAALAEGDALAAPHVAAAAEALAQGRLRGPNVEHVAALVFFHIDLVLDQGLGPEDEALSFRMLCDSLGLSE